MTTALGDLAPTAAARPGVASQRWILAGVAPELAARLRTSSGVVRALFVIVSLFGFWVVLGIYLTAALLVPRGARRWPGWVNLMSVGRVAAVAALILATSQVSLLTSGPLGQGPDIWLPAGGALLAGWALVLTGGRRVTEPSARRIVLGALPALGLGVAIVLGVAIAPQLRWERVLELGLAVVGLIFAAAGMGRTAAGAAVPAVLLGSVAVLLAASGARLQGGVGDVYAAPRAPSALAPAYRRAIGDITLNLRKLPTREPKTLAAETSVGIGSIRLELPANVTATIDVWIGAGGLDVVADVAPASHPAPFASGFALHRVIRVAPVPGLPVSWQDRTRFRITARVGRGCVRIVQPRGSISGGCF